MSIKNKTYFKMFFHPISLPFDPLFFSHFCQSKVFYLNEMSTPSADNDGSQISPFQSLLEAFLRSSNSSMDSDFLE